LGTDLQSEALAATARKSRSGSVSHQSVVNSRWVRPPPARIQVSAFSIFPRPPLNIGEIVLKFGEIVLNFGRIVRALYAG
jgi:hypothetical protein